MPVRTHRITDPRVITVCEVIDLSNAERVARDLARPLVERTAPAVVVDLHATLLTVTGVGVLERTQRLADRLDLQLRIVATLPLARKVLHLTGADRTLDVHPDLTSALRASAPPPR